MFISSPLEQFQILPLIPFFVNNFDFSITNSTIIILIGISFVVMILSSLLLKDGSFYILPSRWQFFFEDMYKIISRMLFDNIGEKKGQFFFVYVFTLFLFILTSNLIGLVPYSFTITSHLIVTFSLSIMSFIAINIICIREHGINILSLFFPAGSPLALALLLIPIEIVSYIFRPISLSVRLFANMMAGHTLLKVIAGFAWSMMKASGFLLIAHIIPLITLVILMGLELAVAFIQTYVFIILINIYLHDAIHLH